ncbi:MAG TPA: class I SAM-dependent methyltransferase [Longimicrobiales bacterium]|nr:class I SAM-dependent methyltransferase [Longimicrobiales bacterium]
MISQEQLFLDGEADAWMQRNPSALEIAGPEHPVLAALAAQELPDTGALLDLGGAAGRVAAGFLRDHAGWSATVVEPSGVAIASGSAAFPAVHYVQGSITSAAAALAGQQAFDVVVICGVLCWIDRACLSRAVASADAALRDGGLLVVCDFDAPFPRANPYAHRPGIFTYKQDYPACFMALGLYHMLHRSSFAHGSGADASDPYDRQWVTTVMRKDLFGRYARNT